MTGPEGPQERIITGFRPTSDLTVGNYLGGIKPALDLQNDPSKDLYVFVADLHGLTDHDPREIGPYRTEVVKDCLALGVDPSKTTIYLQSSIESPITQIANRVAPYISVAELARTPNLKEKMQTAVRKGEAESDDSLRANFGLLGYPVLMAADIYAQRAASVAVGEDQDPHLELARQIARRFNNKFDSQTLVEPQIFAVQALRIASLDGKGKMSKTNANQAILLTDDPEYAAKKIKKAVTAPSGEWSTALESHFIVAENTTESPDELAELAEIKEAHLAGQAVMGDFKKIWSAITARLLEGFQDSKSQISDEDVEAVLSDATEKASSNAESVLSSMKEVMGL